MKFIKFDNKEKAILAFSQWMQDGELFPSYIGNVAIDNIGIIYKPTGVMLKDSDNNIYPEMKEIQGWYVNISESIPELSVFEIDTPSTPSRIFLGN